MILYIFTNLQFNTQINYQTNISIKSSIESTSKKKFYSPYSSEIHITPHNKMRQVEDQT